LTARLAKPPEKERDIGGDQKAAGSFLAEKYPTGLEDYFTVCWWERRGAGLSYRADIPPETMTLQQMVADTLAVTDYLRNRFQKEKIWLMAHCGGSPIGLRAAARAPGSYYAYIGMAQMTYQLKSEMLAYEYMLKRFREMGNVKMVRKLEEAPVRMEVPLPPSYMLLRDKAMHSLGIGTKRSTGYTGRSQ
jgi:pimeloyl-ACP methyl ester carboxylesterase